MNLKIKAVQAHKLAVVGIFLTRLLAFFRKPQPETAPLPHPITTRAEDVLRKAETQGHTCLPFEMLAKQLAKTYAIPLTQVKAWLTEAIAAGDLHADEQALVYRPEIWEWEATIARRLQTVGTYARKIKEADVTKFLLSYPLELTREQKDAVHCAASKGVMVLTGYPGTGKTTCINAILDLFTQHKFVVRLAAPTGRASQRITESTGRTAQTIHRLLHFASNTKTYIWTLLFPVIGDVLIVDESSMLDTRMMAQVLAACSRRVRVIFIGDADQLEAVEAGNCLSDLIESNSVPVVKLTQPYRYDPNSWIGRNAAAIRENRAQDLHFTKPGDGACDSYFIEADSHDDIRRILRQAVTTSLPKRLGYDPMTDIQVIVPMKKTDIGTTALNELLRNGQGDAFGTPDSLTFQVGDKVIHTENNYELNAMNGEIGEVLEVNAEQMVIRFANRDVTYTSDLWPQLNLAHAITGHKFQGSQAPCVVIVVHESFKYMLTRRWVYTALTRAAKHVVFIGQRAALDAAIANNPQRFTGLRQKIIALKFVR